MSLGFFFLCLEGSVPSYCDRLVFESPASWSSSSESSSRGKSDGLRVSKEDW